MKKSRNASRNIMKNVENMSCDMIEQNNNSVSRAFPLFAFLTLVNYALEQQTQIEGV